MMFPELPEHRAAHLFCYTCDKKMDGFIYSLDSFLLVYCSTVCAIHATADYLLRVRRMSMTQVAEHYDIDLNDHDSDEFDLLLTLFAHGEG